jgi:RNA polymerase sigma factor (sigma-70 family)
MRESSDEQLMKSFAGGSMQAFELLYERHRGPLYRYLLRLAGDPATANDLYQGSWEKVIKAKKSYKPDAPFRAWMYRIAHNHAMDHFRRHQPASNEVPENLASDQPEPVEQIIKDSQKTDLHHAIQQLPPEQKDALLLKLESGLDLQTIASVTGVNPETAKSRLRYAVKRLKQILVDRSPPAGDQA